MPFDLFMTVCDSAAEECPSGWVRSKQLHLGFPDPAKTTGADEEVMAVFRAVRDEAVVKVPELLRYDPAS